MKFQITVVVLLFNIFGFSFGLEPKRLIKFNETHTEWLTEEQVLALIGECGARKDHGFMDITDHIDMAELPAAPSAPPPATCNRFVSRTNYFIQRIQIDNWYNKLNQFSGDATNMNTRYYTTAGGEYAATWLRNQYQDIITQSGRSDVSVRLFPHSAWRQPSVIATIRGLRTEERVIVGGHEDSIGSSAQPTTARSPGADDDGSGSISTLEIFRTLVLNGYRPLYTVDFMAYAAEEVGLRGSQAIAQNYASQRIPVRGALQLDMTGYLPSPTSSPVIITDNVNAALTNFVELCTAQYATPTGSSRWTRDRCGYGCSDHASWNSAGYAAAFVFECPFSQSNPNIHTIRDTIDRLNRNHALRFLQLGVAFVVEMAEE
jgi:leucyl aminopeptidase